MDFTPSEARTTVAALAAELLADACTPDALRGLEDAGSYDTTLWAALAEAGLLGVVVPDQYGGLGLGLVELAALLEEAGRHAAHVPLLATGIAATALVRHGSAAQQQALLPGLVSGSAIVTVALSEPLGDELSPATAAVLGPSGWVLDGLKTCVPAGLWASHLLVSAATSDGPRLFLVEASAVTVERQDTITYVPDAQVTLTGASGVLVGDGSTVAHVVQLGQALVCAQLVGVAEEAVRLTADYAKTREQFGHPIAHFQAVGQRVADAFIDTTAIRLTALQAIWLLDAGRDAEKEVAVAKHFAADAGQRVVRAAAHLHGGMGVSREYPLHRYYLAAKQLELTLGSGTRQLARLGRLLADEPV